MLAAAPACSTARPRARQARVHKGGKEVLEQLPYARCAKPPRNGSVCQELIHAVQGRLSDASRLRWPRAPVPSHRCA